MILLIDTHASRAFSIGLLLDGKLVQVNGCDPSTELVSAIEEAKKKIFMKGLKQEISQIIFVRGPGSLTSLRIGSSFALGLKLGLHVKIHAVSIHAISIWDLLAAEYPQAHVFFYTGTKKWIKRNTDVEEMLEIDQICDDAKPWVSNNAQKLEQTLDMINNIAYPNIIELMAKYTYLANDELDLIYNMCCWEI